MPRSTNHLYPCKAVVELKRIICLVISPFMFALLVGAWTRQQRAPRPSNAPGASQRSGIDQSRLVDVLRAAGAKVEVGSPVDQPFFTVSGRVIKVNGEVVQVLEYMFEAAQVAAARGSVGANMVSWIAAPHFFSSDRTLALYVGDDQAVLDVLSGILGGQFGGR